jgi:hypothetical protein
MNSRAIIVLTVLLVFGWAGAALAGETCPVFSPFLPGGLIIHVDNENQLGDVLGDDESIADATPDFPLAPPGSIVYITADILLTLAQTGNDGVEVNVNDVVIVGCTLNPPTVPAPRKPTITAVGGAASAFTFIGSRNVLFDPIINCNGAATAITIAPGANNTVLDSNDIATGTGPCSTAGILVQATSTTATTGTRIIRNRFASDNAGSGNAISVDPGANGVANATPGDIPPFTQCTAATYTAFGSTFFSTSAHSVIGDIAANAAGAPTWAAAAQGNQIVGRWADGIRMEGGEWCIRGNLIGQGPGATGSTLAITGAWGTTTAPAGAVGSGLAARVCDGSAPGDGICLDVEAKGTAVWGNALMGFSGTFAVDDAIHVMGPFPINNPTLTVLGDSLFDNIAGDVAGSGWDDDGVVCEDRDIFIQGSAPGAQRANYNGDDGFDMTNADGDGEGAGCTKRAAIFNNAANFNANNGFEGGSDFIDNNAISNGLDGFALDFGGPEGDNHRFCGNQAMSNGDDGYDVRDGNQFLKALTVGNATCARGNQTVTLISGPPPVTYTGSNFADSNGSDGVEARDNNTFENSVSTRNTVNGFNVRDNNTFSADPNFADCNTVDGFLGDDGNTFNAVIARSNTSSGIHVTGGLNRIFNSLAGSLPATGALCPTVQANGLEVDGGGPNTSNRAWDNVFGAGRRRNGSGGFATETADRGNGNGIRIDAGVLRLNEGQDAASSTGLPTVQADLDGDGRNFEACNTMASNTSLGVFLTAAAVNGNLQVLDDEDGAGGAWLGNIYEQAGSATGAKPNDIQNDSGETVKMEGLWTLVTVGPTPDIFVDGASTSTVQVSSPRNGGATTVDGLYTNCAVGAGGGGTPGPSLILGDVNRNGSFDGDDPAALLTALRNRASWLTDPTDPKFKVSDVARPCGKITRADYNRLLSSWQRVQRGRPALKSQCGSKGTIGFDPASAPRLLTVLSGQAGAAGVRVAIYDFAGRLLLEQKATGAQVALDLVQRELANGVYLAVVESLAADGRTLVREVRKVIVLR